MKKLDPKLKKPPAPPPATQGLTPLDKDRASSVADEGGTSAAFLETQEPLGPAVSGPPRSGRKAPPDEH